jgi:hypothetical protein
MIGLTVLAVQVLLWQSQDISVAIVSETEEGSKEVIISVRNTAGSTLLFYENAEMTGKLEYLSKDGWVEYCDVSYTSDNANAVSQQYGGVFAELAPGEDWDVSIPKEVVSTMKSGTYRVKFTYISEKKYNEYLESAFANKTSENESIDVSDVSEGDVSFPTNGFLPLVGMGAALDDVSEDEEFLASSKSEVFLKTFEYDIDEDIIDRVDISGDENDSVEPKMTRAIPEFKNKVN